MSKVAKTMGLDLESKIEAGDLNFKVIKNANCIKIPMEKGHEETARGDGNVLVHDYGSGYKGLHVSKQIKLYT